MGILPPVRVEQRGGVRSEINPYDKGRDFVPKSMYTKGLGAKIVLEKCVSVLYNMGMKNKEIQVGLISILTQPLYGRYNPSLNGATGLLIRGDSIEEIKDYVVENYDDLLRKLEINDGQMDGMAGYVEKFGTALE